VFAKSATRLQKAVIMLRTKLALALGLATLVLGAAIAVWPQAAVGQPGPKDKVKVSVRYHIIAARDQHVLLYKEMIGQLDKLGFEFQPKLKPFPNTDYEDPTKNVLTGLIARERVPDLLFVPSVASLLVVPAKYEAPNDPPMPVRVRLELPSGYPAAQQLELANQVRTILPLLGFKENIGYDTRGYASKLHTRLVGTIPSDRLDTLLRDLRVQPSGGPTPWLDAAALPYPIRDAIPIVVTEVIPDPEPLKAAAKVEKRGQPYLDKIGPDLWALLAAQEDSKIVRAEIILSYVPRDGADRFPEALIRTAPSLVIEGRLGPVVTGLMRVSQANLLAALPEVSAIRLARRPQIQEWPATPVGADNAKALKQSGLAELHAKGFRGKGVRIGIIDTDFRGYQNAVAAGKLPRLTKLVDLTATMNSDLFPDPTPGDFDAIGHGTHCAMAAALAAPDAELVLVRMDPASLHQVKLIGQLVKGDPASDYSIDRRLDELRSEAQVLEQRRDEIARERRPILDNFEDDRDLKFQYEILGGTVRGWLFTDREWSYRRLADLDREQKQNRQLELRFQRLVDSLRALRGLPIVSTSLVWNDGYPLGGASPLSQWFDQDPARKALWFVSAGNTQGQTWTGPYRDADSNGVMEFAARGTPPATASWTPELNFLAWQLDTGERAAFLREGAKIRVSLQWQEPHDPVDSWQPNEPDRYLTPLANLSLMALRQRDPSGKTEPVDDLEVIAHSATPAQRLENKPNGSTYEQMIEFTAPRSGRYAVRIDRPLPSRWLLETDPATSRPTLVKRPSLAPTGIRPLGAATLSGLETTWELQPRLFVEVIDNPAAARGRPVFQDYATKQGSIPILADARSLLAIGAASLSNQPQPYTAAGAPGTLWNFMKPNLLAYDQLALTGDAPGSAHGAELATPFAAGMAAALLSAGQRPQDLATRLQRLNGSVWRIGGKN
jgi:hypothetical protein